MNRLHELLHNEKQFLQDNETLIYVNNDRLIALFHDGDCLCEVNGTKHKSIEHFLEWLYDENKY